MAGPPEGGHCRNLQGRGTPVLWLGLAVATLAVPQAAAFATAGSHLSLEAQTQMQVQMQRPQLHTTALSSRSVLAPESSGRLAPALALTLALAGAAAARARHAGRRSSCRAVRPQPELTAMSLPQPSPVPMALAGVTAPDSFLPSPAPRLGSGLVGRHLLMPKNIKNRKPHKPVVRPFHSSSKWKYRGDATAGNKPHFGKYALQGLEEAWINSRTIEAVRRTLVQTMERKGKIWIRIFPHQAITKRTAESRMGAGKGALDHYVQAIRPGFILFEMDGVEESIARNAMRKAAHKIPCKTRFLKKEDGPSMFELGLAGLPAEKKRQLAFQKAAGAPGGPRK